MLKEKSKRGRFHHDSVVRKGMISFQYLTLAPHAATFYKSLPVSLVSIISSRFGAVYNDKFAPNRHKPNCGHLFL